MTTTEITYVIERQQREASPWEAFSTTANYRSAREDAEHELQRYGAHQVRIVETRRTEVERITHP